MKIRHEHINATTTGATTVTGPAFRNELISDRQSKHCGDLSWAKLHGIDYPDLHMDSIHRSGVWGVCDGWWGRGHLVDKVYGIVEGSRTH